MRFRSLLLLLSLSAGLSACLVLSAPDRQAHPVEPQTGQKPNIVGYLPLYKGVADSISNEQLANLTHLNLAFANPDASGQFTQGDAFTCMSAGAGQPVHVEQIRAVVSQAHQAGVKVVLSVGGGWIPDCSGDWRQLLNDSHRHQIVANLINLVSDLDLDGVDIDLEGVLLTQIDQDGHYTPFIRELSTQLRAKSRLLTVATASYQGGMIPKAAIGYFDLIYLMSYDAIGPSWGVAGTEHATLQQAQHDLQLWLDRGASQQQLVLGLPFYGYGFGQYRSDYSISELVASYGSEILHRDVIGQPCAGCDYITYNGLNTLTAKTQLASKLASGVMIWELTHDLPAKGSLLNYIYTQLNGITAEKGLESSATR